jgi:hypothetical protein
MRTINLIATTLLVLPIAAIGHDLYLAYGQTGTLDLEQPFKLSYVGWLLQNYAPDQFAQAREVVPADTWSLLIRPILESPTVLAAAVPSAILYAISIVTYIYDRVRSLAPVSARSRGQHNEGKVTIKNKELAKVKYKRK